jgi:hypothetical protein
MLMIRKCDRSGIFDSIDDPVDDLSLITGLPAEHVNPGYERLIKYGVIELREGTIIIPNFIEAQEAKKSDAQRQRESREKRRLAVQSKSVTNRDKMSRAVTRCHGESRLVTPSLADPSLADPSCTKEKKTKAKKKVPTYPPDFETFWEAYPNKVGKGEAVKAWKAARKSGLLPPADKLIEILGEQVSSRDHNASVGVFVPPWPNPSTWLNQRRWEDEPSSKPQPAKPKTQMQKNLDFLDQYLDGDDPLKVSGKTEVVR